MAVVGRMCLVNVLIKASLVFEDIAALAAGKPMLLLLVLQTQFAIVRRPSGVAPPAFNLIGMVRAIVKVVTHAIGVENPPATLRHCRTRNVSHYCSMMLTFFLLTCRTGLAVD